MAIDLNEKLFSYDGVLWELSIRYGDLRGASPLCPKDRFRLDPVRRGGVMPGFERIFRCEECGKEYALSQTVDDTARYFIKKINADRVTNHKVINIDDGFYLVAKDEISASDDHPYWTKARLYKGDKGLVLKVLAGHREMKDKVDLMVEPERERLGFDQNDDHPYGTFTEVIAKFKDSSSTIKKKEESHD